MKFVGIENETPENHFYSLGFGILYLFLFSLEKLNQALLFLMIYNLNVSFLWFYVCVLLLY